MTYNASSGTLNLYTTYSFLYSSARHHLYSSGSRDVPVHFPAFAGRLLECKFQEALLYLLTQLARKMCSGAAVLLARQTSPVVSTWAILEMIHSYTFFYRAASIQGGLIAMSEM